MVKHALAAEGTIDGSVIGRIGMKIKENFNKRFLMRKF